ncbi:MAG: aromatic aminobenezylarsenical efflux permease ArsG family transporter [Chloroflexota bacterium]
MRIMGAVYQALGLGLMGAIAPCIMAANIAALAYISRRMTSPKYTVLAGTLYTLGRMVAYSIIGIIIIIIGHEIPGVEEFFEKGYFVLGPFLIVAGLLMLFIDKLPFFQGGGRLTALGGKVAGWGKIGPFLLGIILALAFCPYSALLFFGILMPSALQAPGGFILPAVFAFSTGLPVLVVGMLLSFGITRVSSWVNAITRSERIIRIIISTVFIGGGIYYVYLWLR